MWIRLLNKLPTVVAPPISSIHWAGASAEDASRTHKQQLDVSRGILTDLGTKYGDLHGFEPKEAGAVWILFDNEAVKVWPHEYSPVPSESMALYLLGDEESAPMSMSHFPMFERTPLFADPLTLEIVSHFDSYPAFDRAIYEAAMVDGQDALQAFYTAIGGVFPKNLWYAMGAHYGRVFGYGSEAMAPKYKVNQLEEIRARRE